MLKFFSQELTEEEQLLFREQMIASEEERQQFNQLQFIFDATHTLQLEKLPNHLSEAEKKIRKRLKRSTYAHSFRKIIMRAAAILILPLILCTIYLYAEWQSEKNSTTFNQVACLNGKVSLITLPDGSTVYLRNGSSLRYPNKFVNNQRLVELHGEGYFEVESDSNNPFYVQTHDGSRIKAYGTAFNITAHKEEDNITVFLERGALDFTLNNSENPVIIEQGIELVYHKKSGLFEKRAKQINECIDWINGKLVFTQAPMEEVAQKLSKHYHTDVIIEDKRLNKYFFDATFTDETIYQVLNMLKQSSPKLIWTIIQADDSSDSRQKITLTMSDK